MSPSKRSKLLPESHSDNEIENAFGGAREIARYVSESSRAVHVGTAISKTFRIAAVINH